MADLTAVEIRDRVLEHLGQKAASQAASAEDAVLVDEAIIAAHAKLRGRGLAPFSMSAIPPWAQVPFRDYVAGDVGGCFGLGDSTKPRQVDAEKELRIQVAIHKPAFTIKATYY